MFKNLFKSLLIVFLITPMVVLAFVDSDKDDETEVEEVEIATSPQVESQVESQSHNKEVVTSNSEDNFPVVAFEIKKSAIDILLDKNVSEMNESERTDYNKLVQSAQNTPKGKRTVEQQEIIDKWNGEDGTGISADAGTGTRSDASSKDRARQLAQAAQELQQLINGERGRKYKSLCETGTITSSSVRYAETCTAYEQDVNALRRKIKSLQQARPQLAANTISACEFARQHLREMADKICNMRVDTSSGTPAQSATSGDTVTCCLNYGSDASCAVLSRSDCELLKP